jgi:hypothetical protein
MLGVTSKPQARRLSMASTVFCACACRPTRATSPILGYRRPTAGAKYSEPISCKMHLLVRGWSFITSQNILLSCSSSRFFFVTTLQDPANTMIESNSSPVYTNMRSQLLRRRPSGCWFVTVSAVLAVFLLLSTFHGHAETTQSRFIFGHQQSSSTGTHMHDTRNKTLGVSSVSYLGEDVSH